MNIIKVNSLNRTTKSVDSKKLEQLQNNFNKINGLENLDINKNTDNNNRIIEEETDKNNQNLANLLPLIQILNNKDKPSNSNQNLQELLMKNLNLKNPILNQLLPLLNTSFKQNSIENEKKEETKISSFINTNDYFFDD